MTTRSDAIFRELDDILGCNRVSSCVLVSTPFGLRERFRRVRPDNSDTAGDIRIAASSALFTKTPTNSAVRTARKPQFSSVFFQKIPQVWLESGGGVGPKLWGYLLNSDLTFVAYDRIRIFDCMTRRPLL